MLSKGLPMPGGIARIRRWEFSRGAEPDPAAAIGHAPLGRPGCLRTDGFCGPQCFVHRPHPPRHFVSDCL